MDKWADYLISAVSYGPNRQITKMRQHEDDGDSISKGTLVDKITVATNLKKGITYITIYSGKSTWKKGNFLKTFRTENEYFLRVDKNRVPLDNLGDLPELENPIPSV